MRTLYHSSLLVLVLLLAACTDPFISVPGGKLKGEVSAAPDTWTSVPDVVQLETRPSDPYSINIWALVDMGNLYLATENARWLPHIAEDDRVKIRIDSQVFELRAVKVTAPEEMNRLAAAYKRKYDYDVDNESFVMANAFRLERR